VSVADPRFDHAGPEEAWLTRLAEGVFTIQSCAGCGSYQFPPSVSCRSCGSVRVALVPQSGDAVVYSSTTVRARAGGYNVSLVELPEGPRMMTRVEGVEPEEIRIGDRVAARIVRRDGGDAIVVFDWCGRP